jgi:hypothetical protein
MNIERWKLSTPDLERSPTEAAATLRDALVIAEIFVVQSVAYRLRVSCPDRLVRANHATGSTWTKLLVWGRWRFLLLDAHNSRQATAIPRPGAADMGAACWWLRACHCKYHIYKPFNCRETRTSPDISFRNFSGAGDSVLPNAVDISVAQMASRGSR